MPRSFIKDPNAILDYKVDWNDWLEVGETISSRTITVGTGITKDSDTVTDAGKSVTIWLSGGSDGATYEVACRITTSLARTDERTITIQCREQ